MTKNIFLIVIRHFFQYKVYSLLNILGLALGITCSLFIGIYVFYEFDYDSFHTYKDRIYRVTVKGNLGDNAINQAITAAPLAAALKNEVPEVEEAVRLARFGSWLVRFQDKKYHEDEILFVDSTFFNIFSFELIQGNENEVLNKPNSIVLTSKMADKYFGTANPVGQILYLEDDSLKYEVTGVVADVPDNSHVKFDFLASLNSIDHSFSDQWLAHNYYTYLLKKQNSGIENLNENLNGLIESYVVPQLKEIIVVAGEDYLGQGNSYQFRLQPLKDIHLRSNLQVELETNGNIRVVYAFLLIAVLILIIACINFMNLTTARSSVRSMEIGLRKVVGANKKQLVFQFLAESTILAFFAMVLALLFVELLFPFFNHLTGLNLDIKSFGRLNVIPVLLALVLFVGIVSGSYPAFILSSFRPIVILQSRFSGRNRHIGMRQILVGFQFTISILILISTFMIHRQISYMQQKEPGFEKENILLIRRSDGLRNHLGAFKEELTKNPDILAVTNSNSIPGRAFSRNGFMLEGRENELNHLLYQLWVREDFLKTYNIPLEQGRFFSKDIPSDTAAIVINTAAMKSLGLKDPLNSYLIQPASNPNQNQNRQFKIIGVINDFHFQSMHNFIQPMVMTLMPGNWEGYISIRLNAGANQETIDFIREKWNSFTTVYPFEYFFLGPDLEQLYQSEKTSARLLLVFSGLSIIIACLGLIGLMTYASEQRTKEIGIRKSLGADGWSIFYLLSGEMLRLMLIASALSWIIGFFVIRYWLQGFSYQATFSIWPFFLASLIVFVISMVSVSAIGISAVFKDPSGSLRYE